LSGGAGKAFPETLPGLLAENACACADEVAMREKDLGYWRSYTWRDYETGVCEIALGMEALGIESGDVVALIGDNRPEWVWGEIAAHALRARSLGLYRDVLEDELHWLVDFSGARLAFAEDEEQVDKFLALGDRLPGLAHIVFDDPRGMRKYDDPRLISLADLRAKGAEAHRQDAGRFHELVRRTRPDDVAILCTTSGTTSNPKLAMLEHQSLIGISRLYLEVDPHDHTDDYVSVQPLPWIVEQIYSVAWGLVARIRVNFAEDASTLMADMREIGPTFALFAPRVWEQIAADVQAGIMDASRFKQWMYRYWLDRGLAALDAGRRSRLADWMLFRSLRDRLGFSNLVSAGTGGAALGPDTFRFFLAMGVPLRQLYGQTEMGGAYTLHHAGDIDFDTVGPPFSGVEIEILRPDSQGLGEIRARHAYAMRGYFRQEEKTRETIDTDGWLATGDAGYFNENGHLVVIDRMDDLATTNAGIRFSPQYIENKIKYSPYVAETVVLGDRRDYLAALICIRWSIVSKWAEQKRMAFTTYTDLSARAEVRDLLAAEIRRVNESLPTQQKIHRFLLLYKELDADDGELTRTRKVRRGFIGDRYGEIIDGLYGTQREVPVDTTIHFQDGSSQRVKTSLEVVRLETGPGSELETNS
jgi:long-chain acyl-CoA synthetase